MKKLKMGTPAMGVAIGAILVGAAALVMIIGFWKALLLVALFAVGFFIGTVDNKQEFIREKANKIIPAKDAKVIDIKSEITRDQDERNHGFQAPVMTETGTKPAGTEEETEEDGE